MFQTRNRTLIGLYFTLLIALLIAAGLASAQWEPTRSTANEFSNTMVARPEVKFGSNKVQVASGTVSTDTIYLPVILKLPGGEWLEVWADEQRAPVLRSLADLFKQAHDVDLVVRQVTNIHEVTAAIQKGYGPDVFVGPHDGLGSWLKEGVLAPIVLGSKEADFVEVALAGFSSGGRLYGLPYAFENMGLFRNVDLVAEEPQTWTELLAAGQALQASGKVSYTLALEDNGYKIYPIATSFGGYIFGHDPDGTWDVDDLGIDKTGMIAAGNWISDSVGAGLVSPIAYDADGAESLFENGRIPFIMTGPWALERIRSAGINYAISSFPDDGLPFVGVQGFMISAYSAKQQLAQLFLTDFVATAEIMELLYQSEHRPPAYLPLLGSINDTDLAAFFDAGQGAALMPAVPEMGAVWGPWNEAVVQVINSTETPEVAFTDAADRIRDIIGGSYLGMVNVPGSYQTLAGCESNWDAACLVTAMTMTAESDGVYTSTHDLPTGDYEAKVALDGSWEENYGLGGVRDGGNIPFSLAAPGTVDFTYDPKTHILTITIKP